GGDGFFPPLWRIDGSVLFNCDVLKLMLPARNILYSLNKTNQQLYDNSISQHLEPQLIENARAVLDGVSGLIVVPNVEWENGEIDLLVFSVDENACLHVQAKAAIPPQGTRMIRAVEDRIDEGL